MAPKYCTQGHANRRCILLNLMVKYMLSAVIDATRSLASADRMERRRTAVTTTANISRAIAFPLDHRANAPIRNKHYKSMKSRGCGEAGVPKGQRCALPLRPVLQPAWNAASVEGLIYLALWRTD